MKWTWDKFGMGESYPHGVELESALLGCMMLYPNSCSLVFELVTEETFSSALHRVLFSHIKKICGAGKALDMTTLRTALQESGNYGVTCDGVEVARVFTTVYDETQNHLKIYAKMLLRSNG